MFAAPTRPPCCAAPTKLPSATAATAGSTVQPSLPANTPASPSSPTLKHTLSAIFVRSAKLVYFNKLYKVSLWCFCDWCGIGKAGDCVLHGG
ncbi:hypothetical protein MA16_Dca025222 [Dendrobium catenatum]|uniref:Uncharacterized protein n=1 Tax=Dendrobium catenatum TaxID=906689 RepID=A0A2I0VRQ9_9ASPA|nr:hypothetical protein MA16_Dca025222 [Dendrobium catenatum]